MPAPLNVQDNISRRVYKRDSNSAVLDKPAVSSLSKAATDIYENILGIGTYTKNAGKIVSNMTRQAISRNREIGAEPQEESQLKSLTRLFAERGQQPEDGDGDSIWKRALTAVGIAVAGAVTATLVFNTQEQNDAESVLRDLEGIDDNEGAIDSVDVDEPPHLTRPDEAPPQSPVAEPVPRTRGFSVARPINEPIERPVQTPGQTPVTQPITPRTRGFGLAVTRPVTEPAQQSVRPAITRRGTNQTPSNSSLDWIRQLVIEHEGVRASPYRDSRGKWTIGVGHLIGNGSSPSGTLSNGQRVNRNTVLTQNEIMEIFEIDFQHHLQGARRGPGWDKANPVQRAGLIDLAFNMGPNWYNSKGFSRNRGTPRALDRGDWEQAAELLRQTSWYNQVGRRAERVISLLTDETGVSSQFNEPPTDPQLLPRFDSASVAIEDAAANVRERRRNNRRRHQDNLSGYNSERPSPPRGFNVARRTPRSTPEPAENTSSDSWLDYFGLSW